MFRPSELVQSYSHRERQPPMNTSSAATASGSISPIALAAIRTDNTSQARVKLRASAVSEYARAMTEQLAEGGLRFPPIVLFTDGQNYWVGDGCHRVEAARQAKLAEIAAEIQTGTERDALLHSICANNSHGVQPTNAD